MLQPEEVTKNGASGAEGRGRAQGGAEPQPLPRRLLQLAGTRVTNSSVAATSGEGSRVEAPLRELLGAGHWAPP